MSSLDLARINIIATPVDLPDDQTARWMSP